MEERTLEEMMAEMAEDEEQVQAHPCYSNCNNCYTEYGQHCCKYEGDGLVCDSEEWDPLNDVCGRWRSDITGMPAGV